VNKRTPGPTPTTNKSNFTTYGEERKKERKKDRKKERKKERTKERKKERKQERQKEYFHDCHPVLLLLPFDTNTVSV
jgi:DNA polymerase sigma